MQILSLNVDLYEYANGTETFLKYDNWRIPRASTSEFSVVSNSSVSTPEAAYARVRNFPQSATFFKYRMETDYQISNKMVSRFFLVEPFVGKTIRAYLRGDLSHRMIELTFTASTPSSLTTFNVTASFYINGSKVVNSIPFGSGMFRETSTRTTVQMYAMTFPFLDSYSQGPAYGAYAEAEGSNESFSCDSQRRTFSSAQASGFQTWFTGGNFPVVDENNPYWDGGISNSGGGGGNFSNISDSISLDQIPVYSAVGTGFATIFKPDLTQLHNLASVMWGNGVFNALQNLVQNIQDMFTSLGIVPFNVTAGNEVEVTWLGLPLTSVYLTLASQQYYEFDMGSIDMANDQRIYTSGSALDYSPFSRLGIFLPFIGFQELDIDECRDCVIGLKYRVDILSGSCVALISLNGNVIYQFSGNCLTQIPITSQSMNSLVSDAVQVGIAISNTAATGAVAGGELAKSMGETGELSFQDIASAHRSMVRSEGSLASATANAAMGMKPNYKKCGAVSASASLLAVRQPYLFLSTPRQSIPEHYQRYCGFPCNISGTLGSFSGYTVVEDIRLNGLVATTPEVAEIYDLLKKGVIV